MPRNLCSTKNLEKKRTAFNELRTTSHYPCNIKLFNKNPRSYDNSLPTITLIEKPILSDLGKILAGFEN